MFACESMLKNGSIATLEMYNNQPRWWIKDAILTERAFYLFQEKGDLLGEEYVIIDDNNPPPPYMKQLPQLKMPFSHIIEMMNKKTQKRRVLACDSAAQAEEYVNLMNLVNSYLNYELLFTQDDSTYQEANKKEKDEKHKTSENDQTNQSNIQQPRKSGPIFITNWVQSYNQHNGTLEFKEEVFDPENFPYLLSFGRENDSVKSLYFPGDSVLFAGNEQHWLGAVQQVLSTFSRESVTSVIFRGNFMIDQVLKSLISSIAQYERLISIEISNNGLANQSLESLGIIFSNCPLITKINLSNNLLGQGNGQQHALELFLTHLLTELDHPQNLDLSDNKFSDESLMPFIKFIFANEDCKLQLFNLENNNFSSFGKRTLLKGYSMSQNKQQLQFKCGPMPFTEASLKHAFNVQYETKVTTSKGKESEPQKVLKSMNRDNLEMRIVRKPNYGGMYLRGLPISKPDRDKLYQIFGKIETTVQLRHNVFIEDIRDLLQEISQLTFEFPRHKLEALFDVVNEKLFQSMECENIYCLEVLLDCLRFMNARNIKAEEKYQELSIIAASVAKDLLKVLNMELLDDNELNTMLDNSLNEAKRIGMRGEIIDVAITLKMLRNNFLTEMQNKSANSDDEGQGVGEDQQQLEYYDEDKTMNVYDEKYDQYVELSAEELGLTSEVEPNLGFHPFTSDYLKISNLNLNYVKKNLKEAQKFLRDEESYAYRNIFDRCYFLLCDCTEDNTQSSKAYNLAKNDQNLKLARIIFRYRNSLDNLFTSKPEPYPSQLVIRQQDGQQEGRRRSTLVSQQPNIKAEENKIHQYKYLLNKDYLEFNGTKLTHPVTKIDKNKAPQAVAFNRNIYSICETDDFTKNTLYAKIQELFEEFVVKKSKIINEDLTDEFFMQIYRQINRKNQTQSEKSAKAISNALFILAIFSRYASPSKDLFEAYEIWLNQLRDKSGTEFFRLISIVINNFNIMKQIDQNTKPYVYWPPCFAEIESVITGEPIYIQIYTPVGDVYQYSVDETTTVETLLTQNIWKEKFFAKEPDCEFYWLYQHVEKSDQFDQPLSKDKKILKLMYKNEKTQGLLQRTSGYKDNFDNSSNSPVRKYSFIKKKSTKFMRKQTIVSTMDTLQENEYQSTILLMRKRLFSALHLDKNVKTLAKKPLNFLYHQVRMDYIEKNILRRLSNYEDVSLFAALILKVKYWGKILRSKDNSLTKELIIKNIDYALPQTFMREKPQEYWVQKIQKDFDRHSLRELSIEEAQERFLNHFAHYHLAYSSYYVMTAQSLKDLTDLNMLKQFELDDGDDMMSNGSRSNRDTFLQQHMNHDLLCVINFNGISFYENLKRDKVIQRIQFDEILYVMGSSDTIKVGFINKMQIKNQDVKVDLFTTNGLNARIVAEDIIAYCQLRLAECSRNEFIEIVKRNIINIFEDMEDPFANPDDDNFSPNRSNNTFRKSSNIGQVRKSNIGAFDFLGEGDMSQASPGKEYENYQNSAKQIQLKIQQQRGHQFRLKEKLLIYLKKYPLYMQKQLATDKGSESQKNLPPLRSSSIVGPAGGAAGTSFNTKDRSSIFKMQLSTQRIEEDKEEDEDDSASIKDYYTADDVSNAYNTNNSVLIKQADKKVHSNKSDYDKYPKTSPGGLSNKSAVTQGKSINNSQISDNSSSNKGRQQPQSAGSVNSQNTNDDASSKKKSQADGDFNPTQQAVINELFKAQKGDVSPEVSEFQKKLSQSKFGSLTQLVDESSQQQDEKVDGEAMVLGQKVNYNEMDKTQKKENLNNILSAVFSILPPPPPPPK